MSKYFVLFEMVDNEFEKIEQILNITIHKIIEKDIQIV